MTQTTFTDNVLVDGSQDVEQLRVQANTTQDSALQTWEDSAGDVLARVTGDGRLQVGDDLGLASPDALVEAHRADTSTSKPTRGIHSLGQISGTLTALVQWMVGELELRGSSAMDALHTALRIRASNMNTGTPTANAELRAADIEVINDASASDDTLPKATGLQVGVTNASGKTITEAAALRLKMDNQGTITIPYSIFAEGPGAAHFEDYLELKSFSVAPGTPDTDFLRLYPKSDGKLYAKNSSGNEYDLTGGGSGGGAGSLIGEIRAFAFTDLATYAPGWLACDGSSVLRSSYSTLFDVIGTTFGSVDGTHFNLPDFRGRMVIGAGAGSGLTTRALGDIGGEETHILSITEMPAHTHSEHVYAPTSTGGTSVVEANRAGGNAKNTGSTGSGAAHQNMSPYGVVVFGIYAG